MSSSSCSEIQISAILLSLACAFIIALVLAVGGAVAQPQQPTKVPRIGFLGVRPDDSKTTFESFKRQLQTLGYIDGKNIVYRVPQRGE